jgi:hypothetical protein
MVQDNILYNVGVQSATDIYLVWLWDQVYMVQISSYMLRPNGLVVLSIETLIM